MGREDFDEDRRRSHGGGGGGRRSHGGGGGSFAGNKRGRDRFQDDGGADVAGRLRSLVIRLGDTAGPQINEHIEQLSQGLRRDIAEHGELILETLMDCAAELPTKTPIYSTLAGLLNASSPEFVGELVARTHAQCLQALCDPSHRDRGRLMLRFLGALVPAAVVKPGAFVEMLRAVVAAARAAVAGGVDAMEEDGGAGPMERLWADYLVYSALAAIVWGGTELRDGAGGPLKELMEAVAEFMTHRKRHAWPALRVFQGEGDADAVGRDLGVEGSESDFLVELLAAMQDLHSKGMPAASVPRVHSHFEPKLAAGVPHSLPPTSVPAPPSPGGGRAARQAAAHASYPPRGGLRLLNAQHTDGDRAPIERFVVEEYILDTLVAYEGTRVECAKVLAKLPLPFAYEPLLAEVLLSQLLRLPNPVYKPVYYAVVIMEICKLQPAFPKYIAGCVKTLFTQIAQVDVECRARVAEWLAHHLSNFRFEWPWARWAGVVGLQENHPQRKFVQSCLEKLQRASYHDRVIQSLVPELHALAPSKPVPHNPYAAGGEHAGEDDDHRAMHEALVRLVRGKRSPEDLRAWVEDTCSPKIGQEGALRVVGHTFYIAGAKSFTHMLTVIERYHTVLESMVGGDLEMEAALVECAATVWRSCGQHTSMAVDRLMAARLVSGKSIAEWVFKPSQVTKWTGEGVWEILHNAVVKMIGRANDDAADLERLEHDVSVYLDADQRLADDVAMAAAAADERPDDPNARSTLKRAQAHKEENDQIVSEIRDRLREVRVSAPQSKEDLTGILFYVFKSFVGVVSSHLESGGDGGDGGDDWLVAALGQLRVVGRKYHAEVAPLEGRLREEVFPEAVDARVREAALGGMGLQL